MAQLRRIIIEPYVITVTNSDEYMRSECDDRCISVILELPGGERTEIPCPYTSGMNGHVYIRTLMETLFFSLYSLGLVRTPYDDLVLRLFSFALAFSVNRHRGHSHGPEIVPIMYIYVAALEEDSLAEVEARSIQEVGSIWAKRATRESVEALSAVRADELEKEASCVICLEELKHDHGHDQDKEQIVKMMCQHVFHRDCITGWLNNSHVCPLCRFEMPAELMKIST